MTITCVEKIYSLNMKSFPEYLEWEKLMTPFPDFDQYDSIVKARKNLIEALTSEYMKLSFDDFDSRKSLSSSKWTVTSVNRDEIFPSTTPADGEEIEATKPGGGKGGAAQDDDEEDIENSSGGEEEDDEDFAGEEASGGSDDGGEEGGEEEDDDGGEGEDEEEGNEVDEEEDLDEEEEEEEDDAPNPKRLKGSGAEVKAKATADKGDDKEESNGAAEGDKKEKSAGDEPVSSSSGNGLKKKAEAEVDGSPSGKKRKVN